MNKKMTNELTAFQQSLMDAAAYWRSTFINRNGRREMDEAEAKFRALVMRAWDKNLIVDPARNLIHD